MLLLPIRRQPTPMPLLRIQQSLSGASSRGLHHSALAAAATAASARKRAAPPTAASTRLLRPATAEAPEYRRVPGISNPDAHAGPRRISDVVEWTKSPLVSLGISNNPKDLTPTSKVFRRLPVNPGFIQLLTEQLHARNQLRPDVTEENRPPLAPTPIQRLSFQHFLVERDTRTLTPGSKRAHYMRGAEGFLFPKAPGSSTLLAGETGGGKTIAYLLPLLQRLKDTGHENLQKEFGLRDSEARSEQRAAYFAAEATKELDEYDEPASAPEFTDDPEELLMSERQPVEDPDEWLTGEELEEFEDFVRKAEQSQGLKDSRKELAQRKTLLDRHRRNPPTDPVLNWTPPSKPEAPFLVRPRSVILAPSHELARQIESCVKSLTHIDRLRTFCTSRNQWRKALERDIGLMARGKWDEVRPIDILVTTPERLLDLITPLKDRNARYKALHSKYILGEDLYGARMLQRHVEKDYRRQLISLDATRAVVCDEADVLWDSDHFVATKYLLRNVYHDRKEAWKKHEKPLPLPPVDIVHVTASVGAAFKKQLSDRFPSTKYVLSKNLHQLPSNLRVKFANAGPTRHFAFAREVRDALLSDPTDQSRVLVFCDRRHTVKLMSMILNRVGILNTTLTSWSRERSHTSNNHLAGFVLDPRTLLSAPPSKEGAAHDEQRSSPDQRASTFAASHGKQDQASSVEGQQEQEQEAPQEEGEEEFMLDADESEELSKELELQEAEREGLDPARVLQAYERHDRRKELMEQHEKARLERKELRRSLGSSIPQPAFLTDEPKKDNRNRRGFKTGELIPADENDDKQEDSKLPSRLGQGRVEDKKNFPRVLITTSLLSRGLDFSPLVTHVLVPDTSAATRAELDTPERHAMSTMELLHRAGRVGRAGAPATLVLFDKVASKANRPVLHRNGRFRGYALGKLEGAVRSLRPLSPGRDGPHTPRSKKADEFARGQIRKDAKEKEEFGF